MEYNGPREDLRNCRVTKAKNGDGHPKVSHNGECLPEIDLAFLRDCGPFDKANQEGLQV